MQEATTTRAPAHGTRMVIVSVTEDGKELEREVKNFADRVREVGECFSQEVTPLGLPEDRYRLVADASGLSDLFDMAYRMEEALHGVTAEPGN